MANQVNSFSRPEFAPVGTNLGVHSKDNNAPIQADLVQTKASPQIDPAKSSQPKSQASTNLTQTEPTTGIKATQQTYSADQAETLEKALATNLPSNQSVDRKHIGSKEEAESLERALHAGIDKPSSETSPSTVNTITGEKTSGHPHLDETTNNAVKSYFNPDTKEVNKEAVKTLLATFKEKGFADPDGTIDFKALGLDLKTIQKAGIKGKVFVKEDGSFDFKVSGKCSNEAVACMTKLKNELDQINSDNALKVPININPATVGPLSAEDQMTLAIGGQIQYRQLPNGEIMKLTLTPGNDGQNDGLSIGVYKSNEDNSLTQQSLSSKIPLKIVFEGGELEGKKVGPFLPNWREEKLFEKSVICTETNSRGTKTRRTNEEDIERIQTQNKLWNAVNEYLKASVDSTEGHFDTSNNASEQPEVAKMDKSKPETIEVKQTTLQETKSEEDILNLGRSINAEFSSTIETASLDNATNIGESTIKNENGEQIARKNLLGAKNESVDLHTKASFAQPTGDIESLPKNQELQESLQVATHEETIVTETGKIYSNQLKELKQKALNGTLKETDIKNFQINLPKPVLNSLNNFFNKNNIHSMQMQDLNTQFASLDDKTCDKMGQAIAQASIQQNTQTIEANTNNETTGDLDIDKILTNLQNEINNLSENAIKEEEKLNFEHIKLIIKATSKDPQKRGNILKLFQKENQNLSDKISQITKDLLDLVGLDETLAAWDGKIDEFKQSLNESLFENFNKNYTAFKDAIKKLSKESSKVKNQLNALLMAVYNNSISVLWDENIDCQLKDRLKAVNEFLDKMLPSLNLTTEFYTKKSTIDLSRFENAEDFAKQILGNEIRQELAQNSINYTSKTDIEIFGDFLTFKNNNSEYTTYDALLNAFIEAKQQQTK